MLIAIFSVIMLWVSPIFAADIQKPVVAGSFYPAESVLLAGQINKYLNDAKPTAIAGDIMALISPHAGYVYSGPVAAYTYKAISGRRYDTVVIIGISHHVLFDGAAYLKKDFYRTPLGEVPIDLEFTAKLAGAEKDTLRENSQAYEEEHSAEVQIPFLQMSIKDFKIVVLLMGRPDYAVCAKLARGLVRTIKESEKKVLIIASTDLSHYLKYDDAVARDRVTLSELLNFDARRFADKVSEGECELCGSAPVITALIAAKDLGAGKIQVLKYANSGDTAGDKSRVVGYASAVIYKIPSLVSKLARFSLRDNHFDIPKICHPRERGDPVFFRLGFPLKDCGNDILTANLDGNEIPSEKSLRGAAAGGDEAIQIASVPFASLGVPPATKPAGRRNDHSKTPPLTDRLQEEGGRMLNSEQKKKLLDIARKTVESYIKNRNIPEFNESDPDLLRHEGAFVTLHKNGELRGCIGNIIGTQPLWRTVRDMAIESSTGDPRFKPVAPDELKDIKIEISVLSRPERVRDTNDIKMGVHGVIVKRGLNSGVFLPQVADETGWSRDEFLSNLCAHKAGLPDDAWKDKETELYIFTAQVFGE